MATKEGVDAFKPRAEATIAAPARDSADEHGSASIRRIGTHQVFVRIIAMELPSDILHQALADLHTISTVLDMYNNYG